MPVSADILDAAVRSVFPTDHLEIEDISSGCGQSYSVTIVSSAFEGKSTLARHRLVNTQLKEHIAQLHAFSQKTYTPAQWAQLQPKDVEMAQ